jgi:hypothetical protein
MALADSGRAIGAVTRLLRDHLLRRGFDVSVGKPEQAAANDTRAKLNLFLYETGFDSALRNVRLRPNEPEPLWLVLKYLLTAFDTDENSDSPAAHDLLGRGISALHQLNFLSLDGLVALDVRLALENNPEPLKLTFDETTADLLSKIMQGTDERYRLSVAFQMRPIMIVPGIDPRYSLLVGVDYTTAPETIIGERGVRIDVQPTLGPSLDRVEPVAFEAGEQIVIFGDDLNGADLEVVLGSTVLNVVSRGPIASRHCRGEPGHAHRFGHGDLGGRAAAGRAAPAVGHAGAIEQSAGREAPSDGVGRRARWERPAGDRRVARNGKRRHRRRLLSGRPDGSTVRCRHGDRQSADPHASRCRGGGAERHVPRRADRQSTAGDRQPRGGGSVSAQVMQMRDPVTFLSGARAEDGLANFWLRQVTLRLRREVCWLWRERGTLAGVDGGTALLPPFSDRTVAVLDFARYDRDKREFFANDATARHLSDLIDAPPPDEHALRNPARGSFTWVAHALALSTVDRFVLATALLPVIDSASGSVIAACLNEPARTEPTLGLVQRLWDAPADVVARFDPAHPFVQYGLLPLPTLGWDVGLAVPGLVGRELLYPGSELPSSFQPIPDTLPDAVSPVDVARLVATHGAHRRIVPVIGAAGAPLASVAAACARVIGQALIAPAAALRREDFQQVLTAAWLRGLAVYLPPEATMARRPDDAIELPLPSLPVTIFVGLHDRGALKQLGGPGVSPPIQVGSLGYAERLECWRTVVPAARSNPDVDATLAEVARRFRSERDVIERVGAELATLDREPRLDDLLAACRNELDLGALAQEVTPRFGLDELMLPPAQTRQINDIVAAMTNLTRVHYEWGTARAWNESGLAALFAGPPGTGKTMAAEALAHTLRLPLYRIDLSQVVNKYIGETEKNLRACSTPPMHRTWSCSSTRPTRCSASAPRSRMRTTATPIWR